MWMHVPGIQYNKKLESIEDEEIGEKMMMMMMMPISTFYDNWNAAIAILFDVFLQ